ncbi:MAG: response regulator transcription factor, partial [Candidatus Aenigmarchaeota archaeon]|nr:response regulator transcription factor [Candidatus Aenigmarchaeota archaeon]
MFLRQFVLILDSKNNKSLYINDLFNDDSFIHPLIKDNLSEGFEIIGKYEPDLILVLDNFNDDIVEICSGIREKTSYYRPIIMVLSDSDNIDKKIELLRIGADDYQNKSIDKKELSLRIFAHLRRHIEELTDPATKLPCPGFSYRILKRNIKCKTKEDIYTLMYLDIDNFVPYREIYG